MRAVSNASPLIALAKAGYLEILPRIFDRVVVPQAVTAEIRAGRDDDPMRQSIEKTDWLEEVVLSPPLTEFAVAHLGAGEAEVIEWASHHDGHTALLDDRAARRAAAAVGIPVMGTLGLTARAVRLGVLPSFEEAVANLRAVGLYVNEKIVQAAIISP